MAALRIVCKRIGAIPHHAHRIVRRSMRHAVRHKAAWVCVATAVGGGMWAAPPMWPGEGFYGRHRVGREAPTTVETSPTASRQFPYYPPEFEYGSTGLAAVLPPGAGEIETAALVSPSTVLPPGSGIAESPVEGSLPQHVSQVAEPWSLALLGTAVALFIVARRPA